MVCAQCGARRPPTGLCPNCGAPPAGRSSMRDWRERSGAGSAAAAPPTRGNSGARWGQSGSQSGRGNSGANWGRDDDARPGSGRYRSPADDYQEVDLERALVPGGGMLPAEMGGGLPGMPGGPLVPSEEEERLLGIRRPVYIPAIGTKKYKLGRWRVISGVLSVVLMCVAAAGIAGFFGQKWLARLNAQTGIYNTPSTINYAGVPATPVITPGPAIKYITSVVTAKREQVDSLGNVHAADITSKFLVNDTVYVFVEVRNAPKGTHSVCAQWFINGQDIQPPNGISALCTTFTAQNVTVQLQEPYPQPGVGMLRIFWDRPTSDTNPSPTDPTLAATIYFGIYMPATPTPVPTSTPKPTGTQTPGTTPSPTK